MLAVKLFLAYLNIWGIPSLVSQSNKSLFSLQKVWMKLLHSLQPMCIGTINQLVDTPSVKAIGELYYMKCGKYTSVKMAIVPCWKDGLPREKRTLMPAIMGQWGAWQPCAFAVLRSVTSHSLTRGFFGIHRIIPCCSVYIDGENTVQNAQAGILWHKVIFLMVRRLPVCCSPANQQRCNNVTTLRSYGSGVNFWDI